LPKATLVFNSSSSFLLLLFMTLLVDQSLFFILMDNLPIAVNLT
jgi:hypothetical protein